jgi:hypothetical protein
MDKPATPLVLKLVFWAALGLLAFGVIKFLTR